MKKIVSLAVVFMLGFSSFGCQKAEVPNNTNPEVVKEKLLKEEIHYDQGGSVVDSISYSYDDVGNIASIMNSRGKEDYEYDGNLVTRRIIKLNDSQSTTTYHYNEKKELAELTTDKDGEVVKTMKYEYDSAGNLIKMITQQPERADTEALYTYNANNEVIESNLELDGTIYKTTFEYDASGNCVKETSFVDGNIDREITSSYENNLMMTQKQEVKAVEMVVEMKFEYNEANQVTKQLMSNDGDPFYTSIEYIYE